MNFSYKFSNGIHKNCISFSHVVITSTGNDRMRETDAVRSCRRLALSACGTALMRVGTTTYVHDSCL